MIKVLTHRLHFWAQQGALVFFYHFIFAATLMFLAQGEAHEVEWNPPAERRGALTDLGPQGNVAVARSFNSYSARFPDGSCEASVRSDGRGKKRILFTGFGLFAGAEYNISGVVVSSILAPGFLADQIQLTQPLSPLSAPMDRRPTASSNGVRTIGRLMLINGMEVEVCGLILDVKWDLAAAVLAYELERFSPQVAILSGRGNDRVIFEGGALNITSSSPGYDHNGDALYSGSAANVPGSSWVLPDMDSSGVSLTWDRSKFRDEVEEIITDLGYTSSFPRRGRQDNVYICNNLALVGGHVARGGEVELAGGQIRLPGVSHGPRIGFLHLPATDLQIPRDALSTERTTIAEWARIMLIAAMSQF